MPFNVVRINRFFVCLFVVVVVSVVVDVVAAVVVVIAGVACRP